MKILILNVRYCLLGKFVFVNLLFYLLLVLVGIFKMRLVYLFLEFLLFFDIEKRKIICLKEYFVKIVNFYIVLKFFKSNFIYSI